MSLGKEFLSEYAYEIYHSEDEFVCGRCKWNRYDNKGFYCGNAHSNEYTHYTSYTDRCGEWEEKQWRMMEK